MALFNIDVDFAKRREEKEARERQAQARKAFSAALVRGGQLPVAPESAAGLTGVNAEQDLQTALRNEELARSAEDARGSFNVDVTDAVLGLQAAGLDPQVTMEALDRQHYLDAARELRDVLDPSQYGNFLNKLDAAPMKSDDGRLFNRFDTRGGYTAIAPDVAALAAERRAAAHENYMTGLRERAHAGDYAALTDLHRAQASDQRFRTEGLMEIAQEPMSPTLLADMLQDKSVHKPERVSARMRDGTQQVLHAVPNLQGGFDYQPATSGGQSIASLFDSGEATALQKDAEYVARVLGMPLDQAVTFLNQSRRKAPEEAWSELVARLVSAQGNTFKTPEDLRTKAAELWTIMQAGPAAGARVPASAQPAPKAPMTSDTRAPGAEALYDQARRALRAGASEAGVRARLRAQGLDPSKL